MGSGFWMGLKGEGLMDDEDQQQQQQEKGFFLGFLMFLRFCILCFVVWENVKKWIIFLGFIFLCLLWLRNGE